MITIFSSRQIISQLGLRPRRDINCLAEKIVISNFTLPNICLLSSPLYIKLVLRKYWYPPKQTPLSSSFDQSASAIRKDWFWLVERIASEAGYQMISAQTNSISCRNKTKKCERVSIIDLLWKCFYKTSMKVFQFLLLNVCVVRCN